METTAKFWDKIAKRYAASPVSNEEAYQKKLALTQQYLGPNMRVLEFGCGTGSTALVHAHKVKQYTAIDISRNMIKIAQDKQAKQPASFDNLEFRQAQLDDLASDSARYDAILGLSVLHLLPEPQRAVEQVYDLLEPGGVFVSNTACLADSMPWIKPILPLGRWLGFFPFVKVFSRTELEAMLEAAGFELKYRWAQAGSKHVYFLVAKKPDLSKSVKN